MIAREAEIHGIDLRLCGEMAGDPMRGNPHWAWYRHLSMNGRSVARVKYLLRRIDFAEAENLAQRSLERNWRPKFAIRLQPLWSVAAWAG